MAEPLAVLGAIGTTAQLLGFLVTILGTVRSFIRNVKKYKKVVKGYILTMAEVRRRISDWQNLWIKPGRSWTGNGLYSHLWGKQGFDNISVRLRRLMEENERLRLEIRQRAKFIPQNNHGNHGFERLLQKLQENPNVNGDQERCLQILREMDLDPQVSRFGFHTAWFTVWHKGVLDSEVDNLKKEVDEFVDVTTRYYIQRHGDGTSQFMEGGLRRKTNTYNQYAILNDKLRTGHERDHWLVLGEPSLKDATELLEEDHCPKVTAMSETESQLTTWKMPPPSDVKCIDINERDFRCMNQQRNMKLFLRSFADETRDRKKAQFMCTSLAAKLANTIILVNRTPWVDNLCLCGISVFHTRDQKYFSVFRGKPKQADCNRASHNASVFFNLAITISELLLRRPVTIVNNKPAQTKPIEADILKVAPIRCMLAVRACFDFSQRTTETDEGFDPRLLRDSIQKITTP